jgi:hypothetical protein
MSQAGVAVGLSLVVEQSFLDLNVPAAAIAGTLILSVIALTTMILQIFGPVAASEGLRRAGEYPAGLTKPNDILGVEPTVSTNHPDQCFEEGTSEEAVDDDEENG